jgi:Lsr2
MAVETVRRDDLDKSEPAEQVFFGFDGQWYAIDLSEKNRERLERALAPFIEKANEIKEPPPKRKASNGGKMAAIRAWANQNGWKLGDRGRVPKDAQEAYAAAHPGS